MNRKKVISVIAASSMLLSCAACTKTEEKTKDDNKKAKKAIIACAEDFTEALFDFDAGLVDYTNLDDDDADEIAESLESVNSLTSGSDTETNQIFSAIVSTFSYEIDEDSLEIDDDEAEVEVTISHFDDSALEGPYDTVDELCDAIEDADTDSYTVTYEFELNDDDEWVISNAKNLFNEFGDCIDVSGIRDYLVSDTTTTTASGDLASAWTGYSWFGSSNGTYTDTSYINFYGGFDYSVVDYDDVEVYFVVERDGQLIYTSESTYSGDFYYYASDDSDSVNGHLPAGTYTVTCYDMAGNVIDSGSCVVINSASGASGASSGTVVTANGTTYLADFDIALFFVSNMPECNLTGEAPVELFLTLADDGTFTMGFDCTTEELIAIMADYIRLNIETIVVDNMGYTRDQIEPMLPQDGIETWEQFLDLMAENMIAGMESSAASSIGGSGTYQIVGSTLVMSNSNGSEREAQINADGTITLQHADGFSVLFVPQA